ncbi:MAG: hypothetical protein EU550_02825 [Promethearchaeota archaeon]|nr:MAG: hypothetical protein EU550_02825 [Candidatus Lokiarchaeota archaeon]
MDDVDDLYKRKSEVKIYPKSMIMIPGRYKDCESLLLALKPETGYLNTHRSRDSVNNISELFYEVEEFVEHPALNGEEKEKILKKFAERFSNKLYGELLEDKWNKKLIGINASLPTEKEMLDSFGKIKSDIEILWYNKPFEIKRLSSGFKKIEPPLSESALLEHLKYNISEPSANFVIENTLKLGANLMNLANTGTIDEIQDDILNYVVELLNCRLKDKQEGCEANQFLSTANSITNDISVQFNNFLDISKKFLTSGEKGSLVELTVKLRNYLNNSLSMESENYTELSEFLIKSIKQSLIETENLRANELESIINYFSEILKNSINLTKKNLPRYLRRRKIILLLRDFGKILDEIFKGEQKPARILSNKIMEKFNLFLMNQIEIDPFIISKSPEMNEEKIVKVFKSLVNENLEDFFNEVVLDIRDLVFFAESMMEKDSKVIRNHIEKFKKFSGEIQFLLGYISRYSTVNRFLKEEPDEEIKDPVTFANRFHRFLERRIGGINLDWKDYILEWIKDYGKKFFNVEEQRDWNLKEIYDDFITYLEQREQKEQKCETFIEVLDTYIAKNSTEKDRENYLDFFKQYELSIEIKTEFPIYIKQRIDKTINEFNVNEEKIKPVNYLNIDNNDSFYGFLRENELKYFSKLLPRPISLILKHNLTNDEKESFSADLFHVLKFRYWGVNSLQIEILDNFKEVHREWMKEL